MFLLKKLSTEEVIENIIGTYLIHIENVLIIIHKYLIDIF